MANLHSYQVDGEVGRFTFTTHSVLHDGQNQYNTGREVFAGLKGLEFYRTAGFKKIAIIYGDTEKSYRKTTKLRNVDEITSPTMHHSFGPPSPDLRSQKY